MAKKWGNLDQRLFSSSRPIRGDFFSNKKKPPVAIVTNSGILINLYKFSYNYSQMKTLPRNLTWTLKEIMNYGTPLKNYCRWVKSNLTLCITTGTLIKKVHHKVSILVRKRPWDINKPILSYTLDLTDVLMENELSTENRISRRLLTACALNEICIIPNVLSKICIVLNVLSTYLTGWKFP